MGSMLCVVALVRLLCAFILDQVILCKQISYSRGSARFCSLIHTLPNAIVALWIICEELPKGTVKTCSGARPELSCCGRKEASCSDNPGVFFHTCLASGPVEKRHCSVCVLISHHSQKWHFPPNTPPPSNTPPPGNKRKSSGRGENDADNAHGGPGRHARVSKDEARTQASPLPFLKSCQYDWVP